MRSITGMAVGTFDGAQWILTANADGFITLSKDGNFVQGWISHRHLIEDVTFIGDSLYYGASKYLFRTTRDLQTTRVEGLTNENSIKFVLGCGSDIILGSLCKKIMKLTNGVVAKETTMKAEALLMTTSDSSVFAIYNDRSVQAFSGSDLAETATGAVPGDRLLTTVAWTSKTGQLWIGDDKGNVIVLDSELKHVATLSNHDGKRIHRIVAVPNSDEVASFDDYGTINFWNVESREVAKTMRFHRQGVRDAGFTSDG